MRRIESHRLRIEHRDVKRRRVVAFEITGSIGDQGKRNRVRLREPILGESLHLPENLLGKFRLDAIFAHPPLQLEQQRIQVSIEILDSPGTDFLAQLIGFPGAKISHRDRNSHRLFLENCDAERALQYWPQTLIRVGYRLQPLAPGQKWMNHLSLDRTRADNRDLDNQIVKTGRLEPWQHRHLRA